jgi:hypothetical protein
MTRAVPESYSPILSAIEGNAMVVCWPIRARRRVCMACTSRCVSRR